MPVARSLLAACIGIASLESAAPAAAGVIAEADQLRVSVADFVDDFEDGVFLAGDPDMANRYLVSCGTVTDDDESGGRLTLAGPDESLAPGCPNGVVVSSFFAAAGEMTITATYAYDLPALDQSYGILATTGDGQRFANLSVARANAEPVGGPDSLVISLVDEQFPAALPIELQLLSDDPDAYERGELIELRLTLTTSPAGFAPSGRFRECPTNPCPPEDQLPFRELDIQIPRNPPAALPNGEFHSPGVTAVSLSNEAPPFAFGLERFVVSYGDIVDDFVGEFGAVVPYIPFCGSAEQSNGILELGDPSEGCGVLLSLDASIPADTNTAARYLFELPEVCGSYGVATGATMENDFARLALVRGVVPGLGEDALAVIGQSESLGIFEQALISESPEDDPSLDGVVAIELELDVAEALVPDAAAPSGPSSGATLPRRFAHGRYRLCTQSDCDGAPWATLDLVTEEPEDPELEACGLTAADLAPPDDLGAIETLGALGTSLVAAPEPTRGALALGALGTLLAVRRRVVALATPPARSGADAAVAPGT